MKDDNKVTKIQAFAVLPHLFIFAGVALIWLGVDPGGWLMTAGFIIYGTVGLVDSIKKGYYKNGWLKVVKCTTKMLIVAFAINYVITGLSFIVLLALMILDILILTPVRIERVRTEGRI